MRGSPLIILSTGTAAGNQSLADDRLALSAHEACFCSSAFHPSLLSRSSADLRAYFYTNLVGTLPIASIRAKSGSGRPGSRQDPQGHFASGMAQRQSDRQLRLHDQLIAGRHRSSGGALSKRRLLASLHDRRRGRWPARVKVANFTFSRRWAKIAKVAPALFVPVSCAFAEATHRKLVMIKAAGTYELFLPDVADAFFILCMSSFP